MHFNPAESDPIIIKRYRADRLFRWLCRIALIVALLFLLLLCGGIVVKGLPAFFQTQITLNYAPPSAGDKNIEKTLKNSIQATYPNISKEDLTILRQLLDLSVRKIMHQTLQQKNPPKTISLPASDLFDYLREHYVRLAPNIQVQFDPYQKWIIKLKMDHRLNRVFNKKFFTQSDSRNPKSAGIMGGLMGTIYLMLITVLLGFPIGLSAAIYLEEFAPKNRITSFIEINIANLAAVPSIVFGLLGLAIFLNTFHLPRSSTLVGGMTLALMTLPTIIVASRSSLRAIPQAIRDGALGLGASKLQTTFHQVVPLAMPGILTGTLIALARALGETAPLLMIGMMAFIVDVPSSPLEPSSALPVQIFTWAKNPEPGFLVNAAGAIMVLMVFLGVLNLIAIFLRQKFEYKDS